MVDSLEPFYTTGDNKNVPYMHEGVPCIRPLMLAAYKAVQFNARGTVIPVVVASPERVYATFWENFVNYKGNWVHKNTLTKEQMEETVRIVRDKSGNYPQLPIPIASLMQDGHPEFDPERNSEVPLRKIKYSDDGRYAYCSDHPTPVILRFQYDVRFDNMLDRDDVISQFWTRFRNNMHVVTVDYGGVWGSRKITLGDASIADNSELEPGETNRVIRITITFSAYGHILPEPFKVPVLRNLRISFRDIQTDEELDHIENIIRR
jgi:hypothetical protein